MYFMTNDDMKVKNYIREYKFVIYGILLTIFGLLLIIFPIYDLVFNLRTYMLPGTPAYYWWINPPVDIITNVYIFNVTNAEEFSKGIDKKIKFQEVGPIVYNEYLVHKNIIYNDNGTMTYTAVRKLIYLPEKNSIKLNETIMVPNFPLLLIVSILHDASFVVKFGINVMIRKLDPQIFKKITIYDFLWNMTEPILDSSQSVAPFMVPTNNVGILENIYNQMEDNFTVLIGPKHTDREFFKITAIDGSEYLPKRINQCEDKVTGSSEGYYYHQKVEKTDVLKFFKKPICRLVDLKYTRDSRKFGINSYRFELPKDFYNRTEPLHNDCYKGSPVLPNGVVDVSPCYYNAPVAASNPHFMYADSVLFESIEGLHPDPEKHTAHVEVEPKIGVPLGGKAMSQVNMVVKNMKGFNERLRKLSNMVLPLIWLEYGQTELPINVQVLFYFGVVILPILDKLFVILAFLIASYLFILYIIKRRRFRNKSVPSKAAASENETKQFLKK